METRGPTEPPHGPAPSLWPLGFAIGITVALVGLVIGSWSAVAVGAVLLLAFGFLWARDVATGMAEPPAVEDAEPGGPESATTGPPALPAQAGGVALAEMEDEEIERFPRNVFLELSTLGIGAAIGGLVTLPVIVMAVGDPFVKDFNPEVDIGPVDDYPEGEFMIATFLAEPAEGEVSRRTAYVRYNGTKDGLPSFTVVSNRCVHLGCPVQVNGLVLTDQAKLLTEDGEPVALTPTTAASGFGCPCHGGQYDTEGNRVAGPPVRALDRYRFEIRDGRLVLMKPYSVAEVEGTGADAKIVGYTLVNPSVHVDGPEALFYPFPAP